MLIALNHPLCIFVISTLLFLYESNTPSTYIRCITISRRDNRKRAMTKVIALFKAFNQPYDLFYEYTIVINL